MTHPLAGRPPPASMLIDVAALLEAYDSVDPDPADPAQRVAFGTSGHRGSSLDGAFNDAHIACITQAICELRTAAGVDGPLYLGVDTHALSEPARRTALEVLAGNGVRVRIAHDLGYTPTPVISHAILRHNGAAGGGVADGIVVTPSHNPPEDGGFKYNAATGGPAGTDATGAIERRANELLHDELRGVKRIPYERALRAPTTERYDCAGHYIDELPRVVDIAAIARAGIRVGVDPMGGASVEVWSRIAEAHGLDLEVVNRRVDPTFAFMMVDRDGKIRMDCSSSYAMAGLIELRDRFDVAIGNDPDADRHGIVTPAGGLMSPNHYLTVSIAYLFAHRPGWPAAAGVGKTVVSSSMIDRLTAEMGRPLVEMPVGFKWFVDGLMDGSLGFAGEESAGASFLAMDGSPWSTDKDGIIMGLLAAEILAVTGRDPGGCYADLEDRFGSPVYARVDAPASREQKAVLKALSPERVADAELAGEPILARLTTAPGNGAPIGGLKVVTENGWFAARPSGTEDIYKIYAESFRGDEHLRRILQEARGIVDTALAGTDA